MNCKSIICLMIVFVSFVLIQGCAVNPEYDQGQIDPELAEMLKSESVANRFQQSPSQGPTVVESAMELSRQYANLSQQAAQLERENKELSEENQQLKETLDTLQSELDKTREELAQANEVMIEMRLELNNWKGEVLGFRDEIRDAETAQLQALLKILHVLGGEVVAENIRSELPDTAVAMLEQPE